MSSNYIEIALSRCILYLSEAEILNLLAKDMSLWKIAIGRGKAFTRASQRKTRLEKKRTE